MKNLLRFSLMVVLLTLVSLPAHAQTDFVGVVRNSVAGLGFAADIPMVVFPIEMFLVESDIGAACPPSPRPLEGRFWMLSGPSE